MNVLRENKRKAILLGEDNNALVWLIIINTVIFAMLSFIEIIYKMSYDREYVAMQIFHSQISDWFTLSANASKLVSRPWTLLTYMFSHQSLMMMVSNLLWLWCFGFILQELSGNNKLIPVYLYGGFFGGIAFMLAENFIPAYNSQLANALPFAGASASVMAVAIATTTFAPSFKLFPRINGGIPLWILTVVFVSINFISVGGNDAPLALAYLAAGLVGFLFVKQLNNGYDAGKWMSDLVNWADDLFNPEKKKAIEIKQQDFYKVTRKPYEKIANFSQQKLDDILDKIHENGFQSLTVEEKEFLKKASKENFNVVKFLKYLFTFLAFAVSCFYVLTSLSCYIKPSFFSATGILAILFPYVFVLMFFIFIISFFINKKACFLFFLILLVGYKNISNSFAFNKSSWTNSKDSITLRVMTWNVQQFVNLMPQSFPEAAPRVKMLKIIDSLKPDVFCAQEYWNVEYYQWLVSLRHELDSLGYHYHYFSNDSVKLFKIGGLESMGIAIFSKYPFLDSGKTHLITTVNSNETMLHTDILIHQKRVRIFTAHLLSYSIYTDTAKAAAEGKNIYQITMQRKHSVESKLRETEELHEKEVDIIHNEMAKSPYPVVYCGDMNTTPCSYNYRTLKDHLQDVFLEKGFGIGKTFYHLLYTLRIDYIFADRNLKVLQCKVIDQKLSDHYPVVADFKWK